MRHYASIALVALLLTAGSLMHAPTPTLAAVSFTVHCYDNGITGEETTAHWDSALIEAEYGHGVKVTKVQFRWTVIGLFGDTYSYAGAPIEGNNARYWPTPFLAYEVIAGAALSNGAAIYSSTVPCVTKP